MKSLKKSLHVLTLCALGALPVVILTGCRTTECCGQCAAPAAPAAAVASTPPTPPVPPKPVLPTVRINAGAAAAFTNSSGHIWLADQGFVGGDVIERPELAIANANDPTIYRTERYSMESFSQPLPNGQYAVKLHFAETFEGISDAGQRVFSFNVEGKEFKDFDVFVKAGGVQKAYVETVNVDIADGKLDIKFTHNIENPEINGIEIVPQ